MEYTDKFKQFRELLSSCEDDFEFAKLLDAVWAHLASVHLQLNQDEPSKYSEAAQVLTKLSAQFKNHK
jgi:hypothetical protein